MVKQVTEHRKGRTNLANLREAVNPQAVELFNHLQSLLTLQQGMERRQFTIPKELQNAAYTWKSNTLHLSPEWRSYVSKSVLCREMMATKSGGQT